MTTHKNKPKQYRLFKDGVLEPLVSSTNLAQFSQAMWDIDSEFYLNHPRKYNPGQLNTRILYARNSLIANRVWVAPSRYIRVGDSKDEVLYTHLMRQGNSPRRLYLVDAQKKSICGPLSITEISKRIGDKPTTSIERARKHKRWYLDRFFVTDDLGEAEAKLKQGVTTRKKYRRLRRIVVYKEGTNHIVAVFKTSLGFNRFYNLSAGQLDTAYRGCNGDRAKVPKQPNLMFSVEYYE